MSTTEEVLTVDEPKGLSVDPASTIEELRAALDRIQGRLLQRRPLDREEQVLLATLAVSIRDAVSAIPSRFGHSSDAIEGLDEVKARLASVSGELASRVRSRRLPPAAELRPEAHAVGADPAPAPIQRARQPRNNRVLAGRVITVAGVVLMLFGGFEFGVSNLLEARSQRHLLAQFQASLEDATAKDSTLVPSEGRPLAIISFPRLHATSVVVEGASPQALKTGPGHVIGTAYPGQAGNAVLAGRRTTYGRPFAPLTNLRAGDLVWVTTSEGWFRYRVTERQTVAPGRPDPVAPTLDARVTLVTSDPPYRASRRLVVVAKLLGPALAPVGVRPVASGPEQTALAGDPGAFASVAIWLELLIVAVIGSWVLYRRWSKTLLSAYLLTTPILLALLFLLFGALDRLLPATL